MNCTLKPVPSQVSIAGKPQKKMPPKKLNVEAQPEASIPQQDSLIKSDSVEKIEPQPELKLGTEDGFFKNVCSNEGILQPDEELTTAKIFLCAEKMIIKDSLEVAKSLLTIVESGESSMSGLQSYQFLYLKGKVLYLSGDYVNAEQNWKIILNDKQLLTTTLEETEKQISVLSLLNGIKNSSLKNSVQSLYREYYKGVHHPQISRLAIKVLKQTDIKELRTEIKKLVQNAWERDEQNMTAELRKIKSNFILNQNQEQSQAELAFLKNQYPDHNQGFFNEVWQFINNNKSGSAISMESLAALYRTADSLVTAGSFVAAQREISKLMNTPLDKKARSLMEKSGNQYCAERRKIASQKFSASKKVSNEKQLKLLLNAKAELENCLNYFPDLSISIKVKKNIVMINKQTQNLAVNQE